MTQVAGIDRPAPRTLTGIIAGMVVATPLLLSGCGAAAPYIRVTGEGGATGGFVLTVELNAGEGPMYT